MKRTIQAAPLTELATFQLTRDSLEVSEFDLFHLAYTTWYGEKPGVQYLDEQFDKYLLSAELPFYVRHYCRGYIEAHPEILNNARREENRSRLIERLVMGLIIGFVAGALILS